MESALFHTAVVLLLTAATVNSQVFHHSTSSIWSFVCQDGVCIKMPRSEVSYTQTLETCKLICDPYATIWPKPTGHVIKGSSTKSFLPENMKVSHRSVHSAETSMVDEAIVDFTKSLMKNHPLYDAEDNTDPFRGLYRHSVEDHRVNVRVIVQGPPVKLDLNTDESYTLRIDTVHNETNVVITSPTFFGLRHGLETLSHVVAYDSLHDSLQIIDTLLVTDKPKFPHRGIILDTSRNYISVKALKKLILAMSYNKLNVLHWHITDSHSFPLVTPRVPLMSMYGAYCSKRVYKPSDILHLVRFARSKGVKIVPELDAPAHVGNGWQWGPKEGKGVLAVCVNREPWESYCLEPPCGQLNPFNDNVYDILGDIYKDMFYVFDSDVFHMGGDEVHLNCWNTTDIVVNAMKQRGMGREKKDFYDVWAEFQRKAVEKVYAANRGNKLPAILWTSHLTETGHVTKYLSPEDYIIQLWTTADDKVNGELANNGFRLIFTNYDHWYLDCGYGHWVTDGNNWCSPYKGWQKVYDNSPLNILKSQGVNDPIKLKLVLGGEVAMWSEQVDEFSLESKVWPRASALAERLWSDPDHGWRDAESRMIQHRYRLMKRGVLAERLQPEWCRQNEGKCKLQDDGEDEDVTADVLAQEEDQVQVQEEDQVPVQVQEEVQVQVQEEDQVPVQVQQEDQVPVQVQEETQVPVLEDVDDS